MATIVGDGGNNTLIGANTNNSLSGLDGDDSLTGLGGLDTLDGGAGNDTLDGGPSYDTASYTTDTAGVVVNLSTGTASGTAVGTDILVNIERATGGSGNNSFTGDAHDNTLTGNAGNDTFEGGGGDDSINGGAGGNVAVLSGAMSDYTFFHRQNGAFSTGILDNRPGSPDGADNYVNVAIYQFSDGILFEDQINPNTGIVGLARPYELVVGHTDGDLLSPKDNFVGPWFNSWLLALGGDDTIAHLQGNVYADAGDGNDSIQADFGTATIDGGAGNDTFAAYHGGISSGSFYSGGFFTIEGGAGDDSFMGVSYNDTTFGGPAASDTLTGGTGGDIFQLVAGATRAAIPDSITDFQVGPGGDVIDISASVPANQNPFTTSHARLIQSGSDALLQLDADAAGATYTWTTALILKNTDAATLTSDNFASPFNFDPQVASLNPPAAIADTVTAAEAGGLNNGTPGINPSGNVLNNDTDPDAGDLKIVMGIAAGNVSGPLSTGVNSSIGGNFGALIIDADGNYTYTVANANASVQALTTGGQLTDVFTYTMADGSGATSTTTLTVTINGADDAPALPTDANAAVNTVAEVAANGTAAGISAVSSDVDGGGLSYSLSDNTGGRFAIDPSTGIVTVANGALLDYETATSHNIMVVVSDGTLSSSQTFLIGVTDVGGVTITGTTGNDIVDVSHTVAAQPLPTIEQDTIAGNAGDDSLNALAGTDTLNGGPGNDTLDGGTGADQLVGDTGNDVYLVDDVSDSITENPGEGTDTVNTTLSAFTLPSNVENLAYIGGGNFNATGNTSGNQITGSTGNDTIFGSSGSDSFTGSGGNDSLTGGIDNDSLDGGSGNDTLNGMFGSDTLRGGDGDDTYIISSFPNGQASILLQGDPGAGVGSGQTFTFLSAPADFFGSASDQTGDGQDDHVTFTYHEPAFTHLWFFDFSTTQLGTNLQPGTYLDAQRAPFATPGHPGLDVSGDGAGSNQVFGSFTISAADFSGQSVLSFAVSFEQHSESPSAPALHGTLNYRNVPAGSPLDTIIEDSNGGIDTVLASVAYTLGANVENLTLTGTDNIDGTGNGLANFITGNSGNNSLNGITGNDTLSGGGGDDTYIIGDAAAVVVESANAGTDLVQSSVSYVLSADVENVTLTGSGNIDATGNTLGNILTGNAGANSLAGNAGNDSLTGGAGSDTLDGGPGLDTAIFSGLSTAYTITRGVGQYTVSGPDGTDTVTNIEALAFSDVTVKIGPPVADFDADANSDLLWQDDDGQAAIWLMSGLSPVSSAAIGSSPGTTWHVKGSGDFNGDGKSDIVWQNDNGQAAIWLMNGTALITGVVVGANPGPSWHVRASADFNGDGKGDLLWQSDSGQAAIWLMDGTALLSGVPVGSNPGPSWRVKWAADFNGDGNADILWQNDSGQAAIWLMNGTGLIAGTPLTPNPGPTFHIKGAGDFDGDGKADILWQDDSGQASLWLMDGTTRLSSTTVGTIGAGWRVKGSGDFNHDGHSDIVWQNDSGQPALWLMNGTTQIGGASVGSNPGVSWHVQAGVDDTRKPTQPTYDFDADRKGDILWQNNSGQVVVWLVKGTTVASGGAVGNPGPTWHLKGSGDFDGDGKADIVLQNDSGQAAIWFMDGTSQAGGALAGTNLGPSWHVKAAGDFDGDGKSDILWQNDSGQAVVWLMDGGTVMGGAFVGANLGPSWHVRGTGDFNGDHTSDILWQNDNGQASIWLMNGTSVAAGALVGSANIALHVKGTGDFDGDGKSDILWQNDNGQASISLMDGTTALSTTAVGNNLGPTWHVMGAVDFDGNRKADIVWQNDSGQAAGWLMDGTSVITTSDIGSNLGPTWHVIWA